jgi:hypothetical protein
MKKPYQIEAQRAVMQLEAMANDGNDRVGVLNCRAGFTPQRTALSRIIAASLLWENSHESGGWCDPGGPFQFRRVQALTSNDGARGFFIDRSQNAALILQQKPCGALTPGHFAHNDIGFEPDSRCAAQPESQGVPPNAADQQQS